MEKERLSVVAAIPNYNMGSMLADLLPSLESQGYDHIYVLDDASTDNSREVVESQSAEVTFVAGKTNRGAGAARNMILDVVQDPTLIHFLDADIRLETNNTAELARQLFSDPERLGFVGGLVLTADQRQSYWNFGERQSLHASVSSWGQSVLEVVGVHHPGLERTIRDHHLWPGLANLPNPTSPPGRQTTFWAVEANLMIMSDRLRDVGGFDEAIREHDIQPLAVATQKAGYINYFDPSIAVTHLAGQVRGYNRNAKAMKTEGYLMKKYGFKNWLLSGPGHNKEAN